MADIATTDPEFDALPIDGLIERLREAMAMTVQSIRVAARCVAALERKGVDLTPLKLATLHHLRKVASGQLLPEVVHSFTCRPSLISRVGNLPLSEQRKYAVEGEPVPVYRRDEDHRLVPLAELTAAEVSQVFAADHIRTKDEQMRVIGRRDEPTPEKPVRIGPLEVHVRERIVYVNNVAVRAEDINAAARLFSR